MPAGLFAPRYWPTWLGVALMRVLVLLPYRAQMCVGRALGRLALRLAPRQHRVTNINLRIAFPEKSDVERAAIARAHFESLGCALFETALAWWASDARIRALTRVVGLEHLQAALAQGSGALLLSAHFTPLEIGVRALLVHARPAIMYQTPKNAVIAHISTQVRHDRTAGSISSDNVRALLRALKGNVAVWYAPDQREHGEGAALVPFFGVPVSTNTATSRLAAISGAAVLPYFAERLPDGAGYGAAIGPALDGFPSGDPLVDAARFHALIEAQARRYPEQYLWSYKRFKRNGLDGDPYARS